MTFSLSVSGSQQPTPEAPYYHPFTEASAVAYDKAVQDLQAALKAAGFHGNANGTRPATQAEYEARPRLKNPDGTERLDTSSKSFSLTY